MLGKKVDKSMAATEEFLGLIDRKEERRKSSIIVPQRLLCTAAMLNYISKAPESDRRM